MDLTNEEIAAKASKLAQEVGELKQCTSTTPATQPSSQPPKPKQKPSATPEGFTSPKFKQLKKGPKKPSSFNAENIPFSIATTAAKVLNDERWKTYKPPPPISLRAIEIMTPQDAAVVVTQRYYFKFNEYPAFWIQPFPTYDPKVVFPIAHIHGFLYNLLAFYYEGMERICCMAKYLNANGSPKQFTTRKQLTKEAIMSTYRYIVIR